MTNTSSARLPSWEDIDEFHHVILAAMMEDFNNDSEYFEPDETRYCDRLCTWIAPDQAEEAYSAEIMDWLNSSTPAEITTLVETFKSLSRDDMSKSRERAIATAILVNLVPDKDYRCYAHGMLACRKAFVDEVRWDFSFNIAWECYIGLLTLNEDGITTMTLEYTTEQTTAILRYLFEVNYYNPNSDSSPVRDVLVKTPPVEDRSLNQRAWVFKDVALRNLIAGNADRASDLAEFTVSRETTDIGLLRELLASDEHGSLLSGHL